MFHINTQKLVRGLKEVNPADPEELDMLQFFFALENDELYLADFKVKTLEKILDKYYRGGSGVFEKSLYHFSRTQQVLVKAEGMIADGFI